MCGIHLHLSRLVQLHDDDDNVNGGTCCNHHQNQDHDDKVVVDGIKDADCVSVEEEERGKAGGCGGAEEEAYYYNYPAWLCRRGPDHQGSLFFHKRIIMEQQLLITTTTNDNDATTIPAVAAVNVVVVLVKLSLQASVLSMREHLVRQPVAILRQTAPKTRVFTTEEVHQHNNSNNENTNDDAIIHLCWNGEVYQEQQEQADQQEASETENDAKDEMPKQQHYHDVWRFQESDTNLVAQRLQEALDVFLLHPAKQFHDPCNDKDKDDSSSPLLQQQHDSSSQLLQQQQQEQENDGIFHAVHKTMSSLINAEFAYCITTPSCIYYGKDPWGCRSLLTGKCCITTTSDMDNDDAASTASLTTAEANSCWYLSSVAMCNSCNNRSSCNIEWTEVPPGIVFEYNFITDQTRSLPLQTLLDKEMRTTTITSSTALNNTAPTSCVEEGNDDKSNGGDGSRHGNNDNATIIHQDDDDDDHDNDELAPSRQLYALLLQAVRRRLTGPCTILFSGGLDSVVLAALALQQQQELEQEEHAAQEQQQQQQQQGCRDYSIALVNISFLDDDDDEKGNSSNSSETQTPTATQLPIVASDTLAAVASYQELQRLYPNAKFEFIQRQVTYKQVAEQEEHIRKLIHPKHSTMDLNIATALWFAAQSTSSSSSLEHRILLTGLGADELMGGYGRHRKAYQRGGACALRDELRLDQERLWERNLGRDDRVLSDHGKEARFPYLDCDVVHFLTSLASSSSSSACLSLCDFSLPPGQGDKRILRLVASHFLHLKVASTAVKRAIQFGSRISHVCDKRRFGSRRKAKGETSALKIGPRMGNEKTQT